MSARQFKCSAVAHFFVFCVLGIYGASSWANKPMVATSIRPLGLLVSDLAGDLVDTQVLLDATASPHDFSLTIAQALTVNDADLLVWIGPDFEYFLAKGIYTQNKLSLANVLGHVATGHNHEEDAHLWMDTDNIEKFAVALSRELVQLLPNQIDALEQRLALFRQQLQARREVIQKSLGPLTSRPFAVHHDAYRHFIQEFGLNQIVQLTKVPHERISAKRLTEVGQKLGSAHCLLTEKAEMRQAKRYADLFEIPMVAVDLLSTDANTRTYDAYLKAISDAFLTCLQKKSPA